MKLINNNFIYKDSYSGYYSVIDECFVTKDEVKFSENENSEDKYVSCPILIVLIE